VMLICAVVLTIAFLLWLILYIKYRNQFVGLLDDVDGKIFTLKDLYFIGLGCIESYEKIRQKKITGSDKAVEKMKRLSEVFGRSNAELYYYVTTGAKISLILTFLPVGLMLTCLLQSIMGLICGALLSFIMPYGIQSSINAAVNDKKDAIISEFPKMVSKLTLLVNAGMLVRRAWDEVANSNYEDALYAEMRITSKDIQEGMSIENAMESFASRCGIKEIRKFSSIYVQAVNRGASESINSMKIMADEAWEQKKQLSKQKGEIASQKLMIPNMIMFIGIMIIVVVPMIAAMMGSFG
ncbi:MAG: type II secretion system F family protein, partial [Treponemataceae bacterium]|nr:type II secretion system F family protein [Treponemataceae bacterium]